MKHTSRIYKFVKTLKPQAQYTYVTTIGKAVLARARANDGAPIFVRQDYSPVYYIPAPDENSATHWGYEGKPLIPHMVDNLNETRDFFDECAERNIPVYGNIQPEYMMLSDVYGASEVNYDPDKLYVWNIDIEVDRDDDRGFAPIEDPFNPVVAITVIWHHMGQTGTVVYGTKDYTATGDELYIKCKNEEELLLTFLDDFKAGQDYPDIVTGWNVQFYDIPYLVNRMKLLFTESTWIHLSPFERLADRRVTLNGKDQTVIDIRGIAILDYLELYRKFTFSQQESYRLDHIAHVELKKRKLTYAEYRSLAELYRQDHQKFIEYNIRDVQLVDELDAKLKLIDLVCALAYGAKSNFVDTFRQVRLWDIMIYHRLRGLGAQIPPRKDEDKTEQYQGAYVKDPIVGEHSWVVSFDVASMYPHIIREWNLSPEMIASRESVGKWSVDDLLQEKVDTDLWVGPVCANDFALAANGLQTWQNEEGFLPAMLRTLYDERNRFKGLMKKAKKELEAIKDDPTKSEERKKLVKQISAYNNQQMVRKVNLNSAYGALGSNYFRFYDTHMAEAVTVTGQYVIRRVAQDLNVYLNGILKTENKDYIIASDTDSVYINMGPFVARYLADKPKSSIVDLLDKFCKSKLDPLIGKTFDDIGTYLNAHTKCLTMVRDVIADRGVWTAKKRYILNVWDSEGVRYDKPQLKIMGIEAIKSSTPSICRDIIIHALNLFMNGTQQELWDYIAKSQAEFMKAPFEDVAFPRSVNGLKKYAAHDGATPIHVKGALTFNATLAKRRNKDEEPIYEGQKIRFAYLRQPNPFGSHVMSAPEGCPESWQIEKYLDYHKQWEKSLVEPLNAILECAGWSAIRVASLFD